MLRSRICWKSFTQCKRKTTRKPFLEVLGLDQAETIIFNHIQDLNYRDECQDLIRGDHHNTLWKHLPMLDPKEVSINGRINNALAVEKGTRRPIVVP